MSFRVNGQLNSHYDVTHNCDVLNPQFDYVPPSLVTLVISNEGGMTPLNLYSVIDEQYCRQDVFDFLHSN